MTGLVVFALMLAICALTLFIVLDNAQLRSARFYIAELEQRQAAILATLDRLNKKGFEDCVVGNDGLFGANLAAMQRELFQNPYALDIGFYKDSELLTCTTGRGVIPERYEVTARDASVRLDVNTEVWLNQRLFLFAYDNPNQDAAFAIIHRGRYNAVIDYSQVVGEDQITRDWALTIHTPTEIQYGAGNTQLAEAPTGRDVLSAGILRNRVCSVGDLYYCVTVSASATDALSTLGVLPALLVLLSLLLGAGSGVTFHRDLRRRSSKPSRVLRGMRNGSVRALYRPIVDLETGHNIGCEVVPSIDDGIGEITGEDLIAIATEIGEQWTLCQMVLKHAVVELTKVGEWPANFSIGFWVAAEDIANHNVARLRDWRRLKNAPFQWVIEVDEHACLEATEALVEIEALDASGFQISVRNFGVGYSNLGMLRSLRANYLRLNPGLIYDIENKPLASSFLPSIVNLAANQGMEVIADGVTSLRQLDLLLELGIKRGQGIAFGECLTTEKLHRQTRQSLSD